MVLAGISVAALGFGGVMNYLANQTTSKINTQQRDLFSIRQRYIISAWAGYGVAAVSGITASIIWSIKGFTYPVVVPTKNSVVLSFGNIF